MQKYIGTKLIQGKPMNLGDYNKYRGWQIPENEYPAKEGYLVVYPDGYESWSPKEVFEGAYRLTDNMNFGLAIEAAKKGHEIARRGWNGKDQFVFLVKADALQKATGYFGECAGEPKTTPALAIKTTANQVQVGWLASQTDMLSDDWMIVE